MGMGRTEIFTARCWCMCARASGGGLLGVLHALSQRQLGEQLVVVMDRVWIQRGGGVVSKVVTLRVEVLHGEVGHHDLWE